MVAASVYQNDSVEHLVALRDAKHEWMQKGSFRLEPPEGARVFLIPRAGEGRLPVTLLRQLGDAVELRLESGATRWASAGQLLHVPQR